MIEIMIDLETWATRPGAAVRSIGAVAFRRDRDDPGAEFYRNIEPWSCLDAGLRVDPKTREWWRGQSDAAKELLESDQQPLAVVAADFYEYFNGVRSMDGPVRVWCQGASFDVPIWEAACAAVRVLVPWAYYDVRDTRTVYDVAGLSRPDMEKLRKGTAHGALDDARHQAECVKLALKMLNGK